MTYDPTPRPLHFTRDAITIGGLELVDVEVRADLVAHDSVPAGTRLTIAGRWAKADTPMPWLREAVAAAGHDQTAATEIRGTTDWLVVGGIVLREVTFRFGHVLVPDAVVLHGTVAEFTGTTTTTVRFTGWDDPPPPPPPEPEPELPKRSVKRIMRDDDGQVIGIEEVVE